MVVKEPYGVVLGIAPWNAPYILGIRSVVVTKFLIEQPEIKKINFTGSTAVGRIIAETAGRNLKPVLMELGGKNNAIVREDANLAHAAQQCCLGSFLHAGQICMSTERILVHDAVFEAFKVEFRKATSTIFGESTPAQPLALKAGVTKVAHLAQDALSKGANLVHGDAPTSDAPHSNRPFALESVGQGMDIYQTESFGPCVSLISVSSDDEAVRIANDTEYGLSGAVFTGDLARGLSIARRIETGAVHINGMTVHDEAGLPHGGAKNSGWGRFNADAGLNEFLRTKTITFRAVD
ncbi:hypothetical protein SBRCBS47491_008728 [Sporothrix bragantina]|uniref:Aldehyde dehydrogenase domain-containing protein n=1 Tax=Sporothrix bragantina TaxID=671064 RepID=A0ABP0CNS0_9PEZI